MRERPPFVWTPDQLQRYAFLRETVQALGLGRPVRLLDVGGAAPNRDGSLGWLPILSRDFNTRLSTAANDPQTLSGAPAAAWDIFAVVLDRRVFQAPGYIVGDGLTLPFPDASFDVVSAMDVLEHIPGSDRPAFLREMIRVSSLLVVLSGPRRDEAVEAAEMGIAEDIRRRYGVEHVQLAEHAACGLISDAETREALESGGAAVTSLGFGSLAAWREAQELRSRYQMRRKSPRVLEKLDAFLAARDMGREFEPPFYRMFWLASKVRAKADLDDLGGTVKARLKKAPEFTGEDREARFQEFAAMAAEMESEAIVSALVVSNGDTGALKNCLRHLLTQKVEFDFEVVIWDREGFGSLAGFIAWEFPSVRVVQSEPNEPETAALGRIVSGLRGDAVILIDASVRLPAHAAESLFARLKAEPAADVRAWQVPWKRYLTQTRSSRQFPWSKAFAGRIPRIKSGGEISAKPKKGWIYSRCLFFRKNAWADKYSLSHKAETRRLFLWD